LGCEAAPNPAPAEVSENLHSLVLRRLRRRAGINPLATKKPRHPMAPGIISTCRPARCRRGRMRRGVASGFGRWPN